MTQKLQLKPTFLYLLLNCARTYSFPLDCLNRIKCLPYHSRLHLVNNDNGSKKIHPSLFSTQKNDRTALVDSTHSPEILQSRRLLFLSSVLLSECFSPPPAKALFGFGAETKRELSFCLATVLRVKYWAMLTVDSIKQTISDDATKSYIEARLGAKALLTGRIGGGANSNVYRLASFQLRGCLKDAPSAITSNKKQRQLEDLSESIIDSLASCVEFDGLESVTDPSPRSSLMENQYTSAKANFVKRLLNERLIPDCENFLKLGGGEDEMLKRVTDFVELKYTAEVPMKVINIS